MNKIVDSIDNFMIMLQKPVMFLLNKSCLIVKKLTDKQRDRITLCLSCIFAGFLFWTISRFNLIDMPKKAILFTLGMIVITFVNCDREIKPVKWRLSIMIPYLIVAILMIVTSFTHDTGRGELELIGLIMIFILIPFYIVIGNKNSEEIEDFFCIVAKGFCYIGLLYILVTILFFPQATQYIPEGSSPFVDYLGIHKNPNTLGCVLLPSVACSIYLYYKQKTVDKLTTTGIKKSQLSKTNYWEMFISLIVIAGSFQLMVLSVARASQLSTLMMGIVGCVALIVVYWKNEIGNKRIYGTVLVIIGIVFIITLQPIISHLFSYVQTVYATTDELSLYDKLNVLSSGRMDIYVYYLKNLSLFGTDVSSIYISPSGRGMYAHNTFLDVAFKSGILAGVTYLIMIIMTFFYALKTFVCSKGIEGTLGVIVIVGFVIYSMFETAIMPFHHGINAMAYIAMASFVVKKA